MKKKSWIYQIILWTFILSILFSYITNFISLHTNIIITCFLIIIVIVIGILFDMLGASSLTSKESTFHAMNSKKIKGAKEAIKIIKNNVKVSSICNDIIGDICGIISGGLGAVLAINIVNRFSANITLTTIVISALISSLTIGGKAICKTIAIRKADKIVFEVSKIITFFKRK